MFNQIFDRILNSSIFFRFPKKYKLKRQHKKKVNLIKSRAKQKIFLIGFNKTGTTSIETALKDLGYIPADQWHFTLLFDNFLKGKISYSQIIDCCETAEFFQDVPFSMLGFWKKVYDRYPNAKYILSVRDNSEQWFQSLYNYHCEKYGDGNNVTEKQLKDAYGKSGMAFRLIMNNYNGLPLYDSSSYQNVYNGHNDEVTNFFNNKNNFLKINVSDSISYEKLCEFLEVKPLANNFPWLNKSK